jgi:P4 family phage/plasmid primase-like protien
MSPSDNKSMSSNSRESGGAVIYEYQDRDGQVVFQILRSPGKRFLVRRRCSGAWAWSLKGGVYIQRGADWFWETVAAPDLLEAPAGKKILAECRLVPYHLPEVIAAAEVWVLEGEKDTDNLRDLGFAATTNPFGAGKWKGEFDQYFRGKTVVVIPDNDEVGRKHARHVAESLRRAGATVKMIELPGLPEKGDASDWLAQRTDKTKAAEELRKIAENTPVYGPPGAESICTAIAPVEVGCGSEGGPGGQDRASSEDNIFDRVRRECGDPFYRLGRSNKINARFFAGVVCAENNILHDPDDETFYVYNPNFGLWEPQSGPWLSHRIAARVLDVARGTQVRFLEAANDEGLRREVIAVMQGMAERRGVFRERRDIVHVANGVLRLLDDGDVVLEPFSPEHYSRNRSPIEFQADAECPRFLGELLLPALPPNDVDLLQKIVGVAVYGLNLPQRIVIFEGTPGGGKTTLIKVLVGIIGQANCYQLRTEHLADRFEIYRYRAKTLLYGPDVPGDFLMHSSAYILKSLVGGDPMSAEGKNLNSDFPVVGNFNVLISCNTRLRVRFDGDIGAWRRRLLILRYENPPPAKRILDFDKVLLREEGPGILRWALQGYVKAMADFRELGDYALSDANRERTEALLAESDSLSHFLKNCVATASEGDVTSNELVEAYARYCPEMGWNPLPITLVERELPGLMLEQFQTARANSIKRDGKSQRGYRGVRLAEVTEEGEP